MEVARPDVLLTDLEMPNMNGLELTAHVRSRPELAGLTVIMITSRSMDKHRRQAMAAGVNVYLTKPYTDHELLQHVADAVDHARRETRGRGLSHTRVIAMSNKTRVLNVRVVGFSAPERQMLNSIFLLSVAPARQIGYKLWNPEAGVAPDMYLLDGDSESAVASWQATFSSTSDRTLVVGSKNTDLGVASASRPLGLKVVGAMDRLAIALNNVRETAAHRCFRAPLPAAACRPTPADIGRRSRAGTDARARPTGMTSQQPALSASMNAMAPMSAPQHPVRQHAPSPTTAIDARARRRQRRAHGRRACRYRA